MELETAADSGRRAAFETHRGRLWGVAYRMLGSRADADDIVQEAYLRWHGAPTTEVRTPEAWLVTTTTRLCIDRLRQLRTEREAYIGPWLPEPLVEEAPAACRQIVSRARRRVREERPRVQVSAAARERLVESFIRAIELRDRDALLALFADEAALTSDGGGKAKAAQKVVRGGASVVRFLLGVLRVAHGHLELDKIAVNGETGLAVRVDGQLVSVMSFVTDGRQILGVYSVLNPDKLRAVPQAPAHAH